ncbi:MAG: hypothetical protein SFY69_09530 [Planctomycetota bacterium]|nr:hypothetical protein [Planctomycetota bacterium]
MKMIIRALGLASVCGLALTACDRGTPASRAGDDAARELTAMSAGGSAPAPEAVRQKVYAGIASDLQGVAADAEGADKAALMLMLASAQSGLGEIPAAEVEQHETTARLRTARIDSHLNRWALSNATAAAAEAFDPSAELARVARAKGEKDTKITEQKQRLATVEARLDSLRERASRTLADAQQRLAEYSRMMDQASRLSATDGEGLVVRANEIRLEGERLRLEGAKLEAEADSVKPVFDEVSAILDQLSNQRADLDEVEAALNRQAAEARREASEARAAGAAVGVEIGNEADALDEFRTQTLAPAYEKTAAAYDKALKSARASSTQESPSAGKAAVMSANLALAELYWARASSADSYASILRTLTRLTPALPGKAQYESRLAGATQERKDALAKANEHLDAAINDAGGVRAQGPIKERLEALRAMLEDAKKLANDERLDAASPLAPPPWLQASLSRAAGSTPERAFDAFLGALRAANPEAVVDSLDLPSDRARQGLLPLVRVTFVAQKSDRLSREKFSKSLGDLLASAGGMGQAIGPMLAQFGGNGVGGISPEALATLSSSSVTWEIAGDRATASGEGLPEPVVFVQRDGTWKQDVPAEIRQILPQAPMMAPMLKGLTDAFAAWNTAVEAGEYADESAAASGLLAKLEPVLGGIMGGGN